MPFVLQLARLPREFITDFKGKIVCCPAINRCNHHDCVNRICANFINGDGIDFFRERVCSLALLCVLLITLCIFATLSLSFSLFFLRREIKDERIERYDNYVRRHKLTDLTLVSKLAFPFAFLFRARIPIEYDINFQFR